VDRWLVEQVQYMRRDGINGLVEFRGLFSAVSRIKRQGKVNMRLITLKYILTMYVHRWCTHR
jgi:hypothetical protein